MPHMDRMPRRMTRFPGSPCTEFMILVEPWVVTTSIDRMWPSKPRTRPPSAGTEYAIPSPQTRSNQPFKIAGWPPNQVGYTKIKPSVHRNASMWAVSCGHVDALARSLHSAFVSLASKSSAYRSSTRTSWPVRRNVSTAMVAMVPMKLSGSGWATTTRNLRGFFIVVRSWFALDRGSRCVARGWTYRGDTALTRCLDTEIGGREFEYIA